EVPAGERDVAERSDGAFDPTAGALVDAWGFGPVARGEAPSDATVAQARQRCGWRRLDLDAAGRQLLQPGRLALDLSAIAKGFGVDLVARRLGALGFE